MSIPILLAVASLVAAAVGGTIFSTPESIEADPSSVLRTLANNIENNPDKIKKLLYEIADDLITPEGLEIPTKYAREFIEVMLNHKYDTWGMPVYGLAPMWVQTESPNRSLILRIQEAVIHRIIFKSLADNIAQGPDEVATIVDALRTSSISIENNSDIDNFTDLLIDLGIVVIPNNPAFIDVRTNELLPLSFGLSSGEKQIREIIFQMKFQAEIKKEMCMIGSRGAGYENFVITDSAYTSANSCTNPGLARAILERIERMRSQGFFDFEEGQNLSKPVYPDDGSVDESNFLAEEEISMLTDEQLDEAIVSGLISPSLMAEVNESSFPSESSASAQKAAEAQAAAQAAAQKAAAAQAAAQKAAAAQAAAQKAAAAQAAAQKAAEAQAAAQKAAEAQKAAALPRGYYYTEDGQLQFDFGSLD